MTGKENSGRPPAASPSGSSEVVYSTDPADFHYMGLNVPCQRACPARTNVPAYIRAGFEGDYALSYELNRQVNLFPGVLGRICSRPCEDSCRHGEKELGQPVNICHLKRAAADLRPAGACYEQRLYAPRNQTVGVVGAGPAGLAAAHDLATLGFGVTIYEALESPGGMLAFGIPEFRLPREILSAEINAILRLGVRVEYGVKLGRDVTTTELLAHHDAVLVAAGCYRANRLKVPGEDLEGVLSGLEFMMAVNAGNPPAVGRRVLVLGAGFTAFDCARTALRLGAEEISICLRRTEHDLKVTRDEIHEAKKEGIVFESLLTAARILGEGSLSGVEFLRTHLARDPASGRQKVEPIPDSEFTLEADTVIVATGQHAEDLGLSGGKRTDQGPGLAAAETENLYVCGDFLTGPATVIEAVAAGRRAAEALARHLAGRKFREAAVAMEDTVLTDRSRTWDYLPRQEMPTLEPLAARLSAYTHEVEKGLAPAEAHSESQRCYLCYLHYEIDMNRCIYCRYCIDVAPRDCIKLVASLELNEDGAVVGYRQTTLWREVAAVVIDNSRCIRCGECVRVCPVDCISVTRVEEVERMLDGGQA
ncbi:MAG: FAD-dependent oxidoreductase [Deltaproteobacteria bacterium]|nr:FAD-dependent oxidoreductase [Deltaproteobacteria bacterium]